MSFLTDLSNKISNVAKEAAKKSSSFMEITNISMQMDKDERAVENYFYEMGKSLFENYAKDSWVQERYSERMCEIRSLQENIEKLKREVSKIKNVKICETCETELESSVLFCPKCGTKCKTEEPQDEMAENEKPECGDQAETFKKCKVCTGDNTIDAKFCSKCGATF